MTCAPGGMIPTPSDGAPTILTLGEFVIPPGIWNASLLDDLNDGGVANEG